VIVFSNGVLSRVSASGGDCSPLTKLDTSRGETFHRFPSFLPDGRHFLYLRISSNPANNGIYVGSLEAVAPDQSGTRILAAQSGAVYAPTPNQQRGHLLFLREGVLMAQPFDPGGMKLIGDAIPVTEQVGSGPGAVGGYFSASSTGVLAYRGGTGFSGGILQLTSLDRRGKTLTSALDPGNYNMPVLSLDGTRVAYRAEQGGNQDIWILDIARGVSTRFTFDPAADTAPVWSPDGSRIAFASDRDGTGNLYLKVATGAGSEELLFKSRENKTPTDWSRDGRFLMFSSIGGKSGNDLWVMPMTGDRKPAPYLQTQFNEINGQFSPDGHFVAYQSDASGAEEIYVQPFPNPAGGKWMISKNGGIIPRWRRDGKELFFLDRTGTSIMVVQVTLIPEFQAGIPQALFSLPNTGPNTFSVSSDGQKIMKFTGSAATSNMQLPTTVVLNWQAGLRK
jgi:eukaryotic-like serine/threonine-protein kinase